MANISADDLKPLVEGFLSDPEVAKGMIAFTDSLYDRYKLKVLGSLGGLQKGMNYATAEANPLGNIIDSRGHISLKGILPILLEKLMPKANKPGSASNTWEEAQKFG